MGEYRYHFPIKPFWDIIKEHNIKVIVNSDCHDPKHLNDQYDRYARILAKKWGLNVIYKL